MSELHSLEIFHLILNLQDCRNHFDMRGKPPAGLFDAKNISFSIVKAADDDLSGHVKSAVSMNWSSCCTELV